MSAHPRPVSDLLFVSFGPIVWAAHFFGVYLTEAVLCAVPGFATGGQVPWIGAGLTVVALSVLMAFAVSSRDAFFSNDKRTRAGALSSFAGPLTIISILAVLWTSIPLFLLPACAPGGV